jgi:hypothetical protein
MSDFWLTFPKVSPPVLSVASEGTAMTPTPEKRHDEALL